LVDNPKELKNKENQRTSPLGIYSKLQAIKQYKGFYCNYCIKQLFISTNFKIIYLLNSLPPQATIDSIHLLASIEKKVKNQMQNTKRNANIITKSIITQKYYNTK